MAKLYLMMGYPGAGKTTTAKIIHELTGAVHICSDEMRLKFFPHPSFSDAEHNSLYRHLDKQTQELLTEGKDVIYDANLNRYRHRKEKYIICERLGAQPVLMWLQTPRELAKVRAAQSSRSHLWPHGESSQEMFERITRSIEDPHPTENYIQIDGTKVTADYVRQKLGLQEA